jgi:hypothetical protein
LLEAIEHIVVGLEMLCFIFEEEERYIKSFVAEVAGEREEDVVHVAQQRNFHEGI